MAEHSKMRSLVKGGVKDGAYRVFMDVKIDSLRREIWKTIHAKGFDDLKLSDCDVAMALGIVVYELIHHTDPTDPRNVGGL